MSRREKKWEKKQSRFNSRGKIKDSWNKDNPTNDTNDRPKTERQKVPSHQHHLPLTPPPPPPPHPPSLLLSLLTPLICVTPSLR